MSETDESKKLVEDLKKSKDEASLLKDKLKALNDEKESWFSKKADIAEQIKKSIEEVKQLKIKRNDLTRKVQELKKERDVLNTEISGNIKVIVQNKKEKETPASGKRINFRKVKSDIEKLEFKLETEPMSFSKEQTLRKQLKSLKKELDESQGMHNMTSELREVSKKTDTLKKQANSFHKEIQKNAKESQDAHENLIAKSNLIDELRKQEEEAYKNFLDLKTEFNKLNEEFQQKHKEFQGSKHQLYEVKEKAHKRKEMEDMKVLKEKAKQVEEKISKRKKLTTEDLLVMQRGSK